jgi:hypothetical protein
MECNTKKKTTEKKMQGKGYNWETYEGKKKTVNAYIKKQ